MLDYTFKELLCPQCKNRMGPGGVQTGGLVDFITIRCTPCNISLTIIPSIGGKELEITVKPVNRKNHA